MIEGAHRAVDRYLDRASRAALYALLVWAPLASGAYHGWPLAVAFLLVGLAAAAWLAGAVAARAWCGVAAPLDLPVLLLLALIAVQLAVGNGALVGWA